MKKELSIISSEDLTEAELRINGSTIEVLFLYYQLVDKMIKNNIGKKSVLKSIIDLTDHTEKLKKNKLDNIELDKILKDIMKGNK